MWSLHKPNHWNRPPKSCSLCTYKKFDDLHFTLSDKCWIKKLSSQEILSTIDASRSCPSCCCQYSFNSYTADLLTRTALLKLVEIPYTMLLVNTTYEASSFTVSKLGSNKSTPLVESIDTASSSIGIQYDLGCQLSLISKSALQGLPSNIYTTGSQAVLIWPCNNRDL